MRWGLETRWLSYLSCDTEEAPGATDEACQESRAAKRHQPRHGSGGDCGPLAGRRSTGPGGRVSAAAVQPGCFEWERVRPAGGFPREWGSPRPVAVRPRPSTLLLLPLGSAKRRPGSTECPGLLVASNFLHF